MVEGDNPWDDFRLNFVTLVMPVDIELRHDLDNSVVEGTFENRSYKLVHAVELTNFSMAGSNTPSAESFFLLEFVLEETRENHEDGLATARRMVDFGMRLVNFYLRCLALATEDRRVRLLTRSTMSGTARFIFSRHATLDGSENTDVDKTALIRSFNLDSVDEPPPSLEPDLVMARMEEFLQLAGSGHPMDDVVFWQLRAENLGFEIGDYEMAVVALQTSVERLIYGVSSAIAVDEGKDLAGVAEVGEKNFSTVLKGLGHSLGGGAWSTGDSSLPLGKYYRDCYGLRNRVTHGGTAVGERDLSAAFESYQELRSDIEQRLLKKKNLFPRTALMVFGTRGIVNRGQMSNSFRAICERIHGEGNPRSFWKHSDER